MILEMKRKHNTDTVKFHHSPEHYSNLVWKSLTMVVAAFVWPYLVGVVAESEYCWFSVCRHWSMTRSLMHLVERVQWVAVVVADAADQFQPFAVKQQEFACNLQYLSICAISRISVWF